MVCSWLPLRFLTTDRARLTVPLAFEVTKQEDRVREIGEIDRSVHGPDQTVLRQHHDGEHAKLSQISQQFMHLKD